MYCPSKYKLLKNVHLLLYACFLFDRTSFKTERYHSQKIHTYEYALKSFNKLKR